MRHSGLMMLQLLLLMQLRSPCNCVLIGRDKTAAPEAPSKLYFAASEEAIEGVKGRKVVLPCEFLGEVPASEKEFKVIWQKDKKTLTFDKAHLDPRFQIVPTDIHTRNKFDMQVHDLKVSDEGMYRCIASYQNQYLVKNVTLLIKVPPTIDDKKSSQQDLVLVEGERKVLRCMADGVPRPNIVWHRLLDGTKIELSNDSVYLIRNVTRDMAGTLVCMASNKVDPPDSRQFRLMVHYAPTVTLVNEQISQHRGKATMVMCSITGNPMPTFYWEYRGRKFDVSVRKPCDPPEPLQKHCMHLSTLHDTRTTVQLNLMINNLTGEDFGLYYCVAHSRLGSDRKAAHVTELEPPRRWQPLPNSRPGLQGGSTGYRPNIYSAQRDDEQQEGRIAPGSLTLSSSDRGRMQPQPQPPPPPPPQSGSLPDENYRSSSAVAMATVMKRVIISAASCSTVCLHLLLSILRL